MGLGIDFGRQLVLMIRSGVLDREFSLLHHGPGNDEMRNIQDGRVEGVNSPTFLLPLASAEKLEWLSFLAQKYLLRTI